MDNLQLQEILEQHELWLKNRQQGKKAVLSNIDLLFEI